MNMIQQIYQDKILFRLKESTKSELWDVCVELDITENYDKLSELLLSAIQQTWRIK